MVAWLQPLQVLSDLGVEVMTNTLVDRLSPRPSVSSSNEGSREGSSSTGHASPSGRGPCLVHVRDGGRAAGVDAESSVEESGYTIAADLVLWTAGSSAVTKLGQVGRLGELCGCGCNVEKLKNRY